MKHNMKMNKKNGQKKLLAAFAVLAMVACIFVAIPVADTEGADPTGANIENGAVQMGTDGSTVAAVKDFAGLQKFVNEKNTEYVNYDTLWIYGNLQVTADITVPVPVVFKTNDSAQTVTIASDKTMTISADVPATENASTGTGVFAVVSKTDSNTLSISGAGTLTVNMGGELNLLTKREGGVEGDHASAIKTVGKLVMDVDNVNINVTTVKTETSNGAHAEGIYGILAVGGLDLGDGTNGSKVSINATGSNISFGINTLAASTLVKVQGTIAGENRGINIGGSLGFTNCTDLTIEGGEKAVQGKYGGAVNITTSTIRMELSDSAYNGGVDDRFGLKIKDNLNVGAGSVLYVDGLHLMPNAQLHDGTAGVSVPLGAIVVSGNYIQSTNTKLTNAIAGLYSESAVAITATEESAASPVDGKLYLVDAQTFGNVIINSDDVKKEGIAASGSTDNAAIQQEYTDGADSLTVVIPSGVTASALTAITIPVSKEMVLMAQNTINTEITITNASGDTTVNKVTLSGFKGTLTIAQGSVKIGGTIQTGTVLVEGDVEMTSDVTIDASTGTPELTIKGKLNSNGYKINVVKGSLVLGDASGLEIEGTVDIVGSSTTDSKISGIVKSGGVNLSGSMTNKNASGDAALTINEGAKATVKSGASIAATAGLITNNGTLTVYGTISGDNNLRNGGTIVMASADAQLPALASGSTGTIDTSIISKEGTWSGTYSTGVYGIEQIITVIGDTTISAGSLVIIQGTLIINENVTLTIEDGAQLWIYGDYASIENNGTITVESDVDVSVDYYTKSGSASKALFSAQDLLTTATGVDGGLVITKAIAVNNGTIVIDCDEPADTLVSSLNLDNAKKFENDGTVTVEKDNLVTITGSSIANGVDGVLELYGQVSGSITNAGTINIDGGYSGTISQAVPGAVVNIVSSTGTVTVNDEGMEMAKGYTVTDKNQIQIVPESNCSAGAIVITSAAVKKTSSAGVVSYENELIVSGSLEAKVVTGTDDNPTVVMTISGPRIHVDEALNLAKGASLNGASGTIIVNGNMTVYTGSGVTQVTMTVNGKVTSTGQITAGKINGAYYKLKATGATTETYYYSDLVTAIEDATAASVKAVEATGNITVGSDVTIPAGMTVRYNNGVASSDKLTISNEKTVSVEATGKLDVTGTVDVKGTLYVADKKTGINKSAVIVSQVKSEGENDVRYTSLASAIAASGENAVTIKLNGTATITSGLVIPVNVTVDTNNNDFIVDKCKVIVNGTLFLNGGNYNVIDDLTKKKDGIVEVNGYIKSGSTMAFDNNKFPAGVYYDVGNYSYITSLGNIATIITDADDQEVDVYGNVTAGDISVAGTADKPVKVNFRTSTLAVDGINTVAVGKITLDHATLVLAAGRAIDAVVAGPTGSVEIVDAVVSAGGLTFVASEDANGAKTFVMSGAIEAQTTPGTVNSVNVNKVLETFEVTVIDTVTVNGLSVTVVDPYTGAPTAGATVNASGKNLYPVVVDGTLVVTGTAATALGNVMINGTLIVDNGSITVSAGRVAVLGTLSALEATATKTVAGTMTVDYLYVGMTEEDVLETAGVATVSGNIIVNNAMYVAPGSIVPETMVEGLKYINFHVEDAIWFTAYGKTAAATVTAENIPVEDVDFEGWSSTADLKNVIDTGAVGYDTTFTINGTYTDLYAKIDYYVYTVIVNTDGGIASVAIDGNLLINAVGGTFITDDGVDVGFPLKAGTHKLTYTLKSGYEGEAVMTIDGTAVSGYTFELSGDFTEDIVINLAGTTPVTSQPVVIENGGDSGMGLTDILLIVLVVLILIMAAIVAMRLMRN